MGKNEICKKIEIYKKEEIDNFIEKLELSKRYFEICGRFLGDYYIIVENKFFDKSPYHQLMKSIEKEYTGSEELFECIISTDFLPIEITNDDLKDKREILKEIEDQINELNKRKEEILKNP